MVLLPFEPGTIIKRPAIFSSYLNYGGFFDHLAIVVNPEINQIIEYVETGIIIKRSLDITWDGFPLELVQEDHRFTNLSKKKTLHRALEYHKESRGGIYPIPFDYRFHNCQNFIHECITGSFYWGYQGQSWELVILIFWSLFIVILYNIISE